MRELVYAMRFAGQLAPAGTAGDVLELAATAPSCTLTATVGLSGLGVALLPTDGGEATFASEITFTGAMGFQEVGTIAFGDGNVVRFATVGSGYLGAGPDPARKHGGVVWRVMGGEGQFAGASGLITSNVMIGEDLAVVDHHFGIIFLPYGVAPEIAHRARSCS